MIGQRSSQRVWNASRLARGLHANLFAMGLRVITQLAALPLLFAFWDAARVGAWLMVVAVPAYLILFAQGHASAAANQVLTGQATDGGAGALFTATNRRIVAGTLALLLAGTALVWAFSADIAQLLDRTDPAVVICALWLYALASARIALLEIPLRRAGRYPFVIAHGAITAAAELPAIAVALLLDAEIGGAITAIALVRIAGWLIAEWTARRSDPAIFDARPSTCAIKPKGVWAFMALPLILGINLQGYVILTGAFYGAVAVAGYVAVRTIVRLFDLFASFLFSAFYFETAHLTDDGAVKRRVMASATALALVAGALFGLVLFAFGPSILNWWIGGVVAFDYAIAAILFAAAMFRTLASAPAAILASRNDHSKFVGVYLAASIICAAISMLLARSGASLAGALALLVLAEASQTIAAFRRALKVSDYTLRALLADLIHEDRLDDLQRLCLTLNNRGHHHV